VGSQFPSNVRHACLSWCGRGSLSTHASRPFRLHHVGTLFQYVRGFGNQIMAACRPPSGETIFVLAFFVSIENGLFCPIGIVPCTLPLKLPPGIRPRDTPPLFPFNTWFGWFFLGRFPFLASTRQTVVGHKRAPPHNSRFFAIDSRPKHTNRFSFTGTFLIYGISLFLFSGLWTRFSRRPFAGNCAW